METAGRIFHNTALSDEAPAGWQTVGELYRQLLHRDMGNRDIANQDPGFRDNIHTFEERGLAAAVSGAELFVFTLLLHGAVAATTGGPARATARGEETSDVIR